MRALSTPFDDAAGLADGAARLVTRNIRLTVPICLVLIFGSFAAATALSMRMDRSHALNEAALFESARARDLAAVAGASLDRFAQLGSVYAAHPDTDPQLPGLINIAVFDRSGAMLALLHRRNVPSRPGAFAGQRAVYS